MLNYKDEINPGKSIFLNFNHDHDNDQEKIALSESKFSEDFFQIKDSYQSILEYYEKENGDILPILQQLNSFFSNNIDELKKIDISPISILFSEIGFNKFLFDIFSGGTISKDIFDELICHFCIILDLVEFQNFFKSYEKFQCIYDLFLNYQGDKKDILFFCLLKYYNCQFQYESTYISLFNNFELLSKMIFDIKQIPLWNYQLSDLILSSVFAKKNSSIIDKSIKENLILMYPNIIQNLPPFEADDYECLLIFYHICKKMVKTNSQVLYLLEKADKLEILLSAPLEDSDDFIKCRIDFLRICLSSDIKKPFKTELLNERRFSFDFTIITVISKYEKIPHKLIESSLKFLSSFLPDLIDELTYKYRPNLIIDFVKVALEEGQFKEKIQSIQLIKSIIQIKFIPFIRELLKIEDENIFYSLSDIIQTTDSDELIINILLMIQVLCDYLQNSGHRNLRSNFNQLVIQCDLQTNIENLSESQNEKITELSTYIMGKFIYYSNLSEDSNF